MEADGRELRAFDGKMIAWAIPWAIPWAVT
jgi:hypothetical protein